jgi:hypothetical protein
MALLHKYSAPTIRSDVDIFSIPGTCTTIQDSFYQEYKSIVNVQDSNSKIEFRIVGNSNHYVDLNDSFLYIRAKIVDNKGADLTSTDEYSVCNYFLHSMFSQVDLLINNQNITDGNNCYGYKSFIQSVLAFGPDYFHSQAQSALFFKDKPGTTVANSGYKLRKAYVSSSQTFELCDKLKLDLTNQNRYILNDTNLSIVLTRASDEFALEYTPPALIVNTDGTTTQPPSKNPKIKILDASLFVRKKILYPSIVLAHQRLMSDGETAKYPIKNSSVKYFTIPSSNQSFVEENIFQGRVPSRIVLGLVPNTAFTGSYESNPLSFQHQNLGQIAISVDNAPVPIKPITLDFANNEYLLPYYLWYASSGLANHNFGFLIDRDDFKTGGHCLYPFDLRPIAGDSSLHLEKTGSVRVELKFKRALATALTLIVYYETQGLIEIDQFRQVSVQ